MLVCRPLQAALDRLLPARKHSKSANLFLAVWSPGWGGRWGKRGEEILTDTRRARSPHRCRPLRRDRGAPAAGDDDGHRVAASQAAALPLPLELRSAGGVVGAALADGGGAVAGVGEGGGGVGKGEVRVGDVRDGGGGGGRGRGDEAGGGSAGADGAVEIQ
jgi:hypothetical protein